MKAADGKLFAAALAHAFLTSPEWNAKSLSAAAGQVAGVRARWLLSVVELTLAAYREKPVGSQRELTSFLANSPPILRAVKRGRRNDTPLKPAHWILAEADECTTRNGAHLLSGVAELAELLALTQAELEWFADARGLNPDSQHRSFDHYRYVWKRRPGRTPRLLEVPGLRLRTVQRALVDNVLSSLPVNDAAHGFVRGRSAISGSRVHEGSAMVVATDLQNFFASVTAAKIYGSLRRTGYPEAVSHLITHLATHVTPRRVIMSMPAGGTPTQREVLAKRLRLPHLPQGAPTSPPLANISLRFLDARLSGLASAAGASYTRYADDLSFSGEEAFARGAKRFLQSVEKIVAEQGHALNPAKTRLLPASVRQQVTGIVVNRHSNYSREQFDAVKATLHNCWRLGPSSQNRSEHPDFQAQLLGKICWIKQLNPQRGAKLLAIYQKIDWNA